MRAKLYMLLCLWLFAAKTFFAQITTHVFWECRLEYQCPWGWKEFDHSVVFTPSYSGGGVKAVGVEGGDLIIYSLLDNNEYSFELSDDRCSRKGHLKYSKLGTIEYLSGSWETNGDNTAMWGTGLCCRGRIELRREITTPPSKKAGTAYSADNALTSDFSTYSRLEAGQKYVLKNVLFELNSSELQPESFPELSVLAKQLKENNKMIISLEGHTDIIGQHKSNIQLSKQRVKSVKKYLKKQGIAGNRIKLKWYGDTQPLIKSGTVEERKMNRRVELRVLKS